MDNAVEDTATIATMEEEEQVEDDSLMEDEDRILLQQQGSDKCEDHVNVKLEFRYKKGVVYVYDQYSVLGECEFWGTCKACRLRVYAPRDSDANDCLNRAYERGGLGCYSVRHGKLKHIKPRETKETKATRINVNTDSRFKMTECRGNHPIIPDAYGREDDKYGSLLDMYNGIKNDVRIIKKSSKKTGVKIKIHESVRKFLRNNTRRVEVKKT